MQVRPMRPERYREVAAELHALLRVPSPATSPFPPPPESSARACSGARPAHARECARPVAPAGDALSPECRRPSHCPKS